LKSVNNRYAYAYTILLVIIIDIEEEISLIIEFSDIEGKTSLFVSQEHSRQSITEKVDNQALKVSILENETSFYK